MPIQTSHTPVFTSKATPEAAYLGPKITDAQRAELSGGAVAINPDVFPAHDHFRWAHAESTSHPDFDSEAPLVIGRATNMPVIERSGDAVRPVYGADQRPKDKEGVILGSRQYADESIATEVRAIGSSSFLGPQSGEATMAGRLEHRNNAGEETKFKMLGALTTGDSVAVYGYDTQGNFVPLHERLTPDQQTLFCWALYQGLTGQHNQLPPEVHTPQMAVATVA